MSTHDKPELDLLMLADFGDTLAPESDTPPAELRRSVLTSLAQSPRRWSLTHLFGPRLAWRVGAPACAAAAAVAALLAAQVMSISGSTPAPPSSPGAQSTSGQSTGTQGPLAAGRILLMAAQRASVARSPSVEPRPDQFLFEERLQRSAAMAGGQPQPTTRVRTWQSVDGTRDGLTTSEPVDGGAVTSHRLSGCRDGLRAETIDRPESSQKVPCTPQPALTGGDLPTDPGQMRDHLYREGNRAAHHVWVGDVSRIREGGTVDSGRVYRYSPDHNAFQHLVTLLSEHAAPEVQATAFRAAERIPGVTTRAQATDLRGRTGVAVVRAEGGVSLELVFDPSTYEFLGSNTALTEFPQPNVVLSEPTGGGGQTILIIDSSGQAPGDMLSQSAQVRSAVVDAPGQLP